MKRIPSHKRLMALYDTSSHQQAWQDMICGEMIQTLRYLLPRLDDTVGQRLHRHMDTVLTGADIHTVCDLYRSVLAVGEAMKDLEKHYGQEDTW